jgi:HK97 gp10 family phage protein
MPSGDGYNIKFDRRAIESLAFSNEIRDGLVVLGQEAEREAKALAPVDTGNLRRSIYSDVRRDRKGWYMQYGTNVYYGIYQELGTRFHPPHPFLRPVLSVLRKMLKG